MELPPPARNRFFEDQSKFRQKRNVAQRGKTANGPEQHGQRNLPLHPTMQQAAKNTLQNTMKNISEKCKFYQITVISYYSL